MTLERYEHVCTVRDILHVIDKYLGRDFMLRCEEILEESLETAKLVNKLIKRMFIVNYSDDESMVRVDFFKPSGKWVDTEAVKFLGYNDCILGAFAKSLREHFKDNPLRFSDLDAVCLEPYHKHSHPIQLKAGSWVKKKLSPEENAKLIRQDLLKAGHSLEQIKEWEKAFN